MSSWRYRGKIIAEMLGFMIYDVVNVIKSCQVLSSSLFGSARPLSVLSGCSSCASFKRKKATWLSGTGGCGGLHAGSH